MSFSDSDDHVSSPDDVGNFRPAPSKGFITHHVDLSIKPPPRQWLSSNFLKGYVTGTAAAGGTGKTAKADVDVVSACIGKDLFNRREPIKAGPQVVLYFSLEDDEDEMRRRMLAIAMHYRLNNEESALLANNLVTIYEVPPGMKVATRNHGNPEVNREAVISICNIIESFNADIVNIDPLVSFHDVEESTQMQKVLEALRFIARSKRVAVHFNHHVRKRQQDAATSSDDMRGGTALRDGCRNLIILSRISDSEAQKRGIDEDERRFLFCAESVKPNMVAAGGGKTWYRTWGVNLDNADDDYEADFVGVCTGYDIPEAVKPSELLSDEATARILAAISAAPVDKRMAHHNNSGYIGKLIAQQSDGVMSMDSSASRGAIKGLIDHWVSQGLLAESQHRRDGGRESPCYEYGEGIDAIDNPKPKLSVVNNNDCPF